MATETYRGVVREGAIKLLDKPALAEGTEVLVTPILKKPGSPTALLAAINSAPPVPPPWVDELEQLIAEGHRPPTQEILFDDLHDDSEQN